jgi:hypothetical protein
MRSRLSIVLVCLICLVAAACSAPVHDGSSASAPPTSGPSSGQSAAPRYAVETGADRSILRISDQGGFTAPGYQLIRTPRFALYGDGRAIVMGPVDSIYPGPLLPNIRQVHVSSADIQTILAAADAAGLLGQDANYNDANISDATTTVFATRVDNVTHVIRVYALDEATTSQSGDVGAARARLRAFQSKVLDLPAFLGRSIADEAYQSTSMRVFTSRKQTLDQVSPSPQVVAWPLAADPATAGQTTDTEGIRCLLLSGSDLAAFMTVATTANNATIWTAPSGRYSVSVRPLYPDESGCSTAA